jgi:hypothetical protein
MANPKNGKQELKTKARERLNAKTFSALADVYDKMLAVRKGEWIAAKRSEFELKVGSKERTKRLYLYLSKPLKRYRHLSNTQKSASTYYPPATAACTFTKTRLTWHWQRLIPC